MILEILKYGRNDTWFGVSSEILFVSLSRKAKKAELSYFPAQKKINKINFNGYNNYYYCCLSNLLCSLINTHLTYLVNRFN